MADDPTPDPAAQARQPLGVVKPAKPISEMTDAERRAFADDVFDMMAARRKAAAELTE